MTSKAKAPTNAAVKAAAEASAAAVEAATPAVAAVAEAIESGKTEAEKTAATFDWDALPEAVAPEYTRTASKRIEDVEKTTPAAIVARIKESFNAYKPAGHDTEHPKKTVLSWRKQECGTPARAKEFLRLAKRYAENVEPRITLRAGIDEKNAPTVVRFMAKPLEVRMISAAATQPVPTETGSEPAAEAAENAA